MSIGLIVKKCDNFFSAGINQQGIYTYNLLKSMGYNIEIYCENVSSQYLNVGTKSKKYTLKKIEDIHSTKHDIVICISNNINTDTYNILKSNNTKVIYFVCGNYLYLIHECYLYNIHTEMIKLMENTNFDEIWTFSMYNYMKDFLSILYKKPVKTMPYVWDNTILKTSNNKIVCNKSQSVGGPVNIVISEPNFSIHKSSFIPLLICEDILDEYPNIINKIFLICGDGVNRDVVMRFKNINTKIEFYPRVQTYLLLESLNKLEEQCIFLSHNINNDQNFIMHEIVSCGWKLVHNAPYFSNHGYYYNTTVNAYDIKGGSSVLKNAIDSQYKLDKKVEQLDKKVINDMRVLLRV